MLQQEASRGNGFEIPDALKLLKRLDVKGKVVTGDAMFCQKSIAAKIVARGGDYILPIKDNQKILREAVQTAFNEPISPLASHNSGVEKGHGRIERRQIDVLPAKAAGVEDERPSGRQNCRVMRWRQRKVNGKWQDSRVEIVYLISSLSPTATRTAATTRPATSPRSCGSLSRSSNPSHAIEKFEDDRNRATRLFASFH